MNVTFTIWQRMNLEGIITRQKMGMGADLLVLLELWKKITVSEDIRKEYAIKPCAACGQGRMWNQEKLEIAATSQIDLEKAEARKALTLIEGWREFTVLDLKWLAPLKKSLQTAGGYDDPSAAPTAAAAGGGPAARRRGGRAN